MDEIVNKVAQSDLKIIDLTQFVDQNEKIFFDLKGYLFEAQILREKEFRNQLNELDWSVYKNKNVALGCSVDTIIPVWAYMLVVSRLEPYANKIVMGNLESLENEIFREALSKFPVENYEGQKVIIKGCGEIPIPDFAYAEITRLLKPVAASIMYGEPCSTVPIFKRPK